MYADPNSIITPDGSELVELLPTTRSGICPTENKVLAKVLNLGKGVPRGSATLTANTPSTTVTDANCVSTSVIVMSPKTATAAAGVTTTSWVAGTGSFVITHSNTADTDRTFAYAIF